MFLVKIFQGKLVKLFSDQLQAKKRISPQNLPHEFQNRSLKLWLQVVGLTSKLNQVIYIPQKHPINAVLRPTQ